LDDEPAAEQKEGRKKSDGGGHQYTVPTGAGRAIMHACSPKADGRFNAAKPILLKEKRFQIRPAIACGPDGLLIAAWMELHESGKRIVVAEIGGEE
jgi:hypothetical protein